MKNLHHNRVLILLFAATTVLVLALFWPETKKPGELQKYYSLPQQQLINMEYRGEMMLGDKAKVHIQYAITREENPLKPKEPVYKVDIRELKSIEKTTEKRVTELAKVKTFYASALVRTIIQDWSEPDFYFIIAHEPQRDAEYGITNCENKLTLTFKSTKRQFCIGKSTHGDTRRYVLDSEKDKLLLTPDFTVRRIVNNIFAQREQSLHPFGADGADLIEVKIGAESLAKLPSLREKTGGNFKLRMLVKDEGKNKINVWHVENLLSVKPSHAAEFAQLLYALRLSAPFALDAAGSAATLADIAGMAAIDVKAQAAVTGSIRLKKTDKQDLVLTNFAFYPPGIKPAQVSGYQFDQQLTRPNDTLMLTNYNTGYITGDLFPRLSAILQKFEGDLLEAQKKGEQEKTGKEKKAPKNPVGNSPKN